MWTLQTTAPVGRGALTFRLLPGAVKTIGRAPQADFIVEVPLISRIHCRVAVGPAGELTVEDLESTNGVLVNGRRVARAVLVAGDVLTLGGVHLRIDRSGAAGN